ncbi:MAG TPA: tetratricopeptide repeat protein, partial [Acetobacteraceae bacterium]|nr:tetratricopeptide repeat protein [Acetobacteraceae bacterium]
IPEKSVAVLPFVNMSSDKEQEYFSDGLSDELIQMLANVPDLRVPGRTSSFYFKGRNETLDTIAKQLKVANVLEGSVRKADGRLRVTADLVRSDNGYRLWSATYDREAKDIFKVQDEIATAVVTALQAKLLPTGKVAARRTSSTDAYDQYLLALQFRKSAATVESGRQAAAALRKAIALDPNYAAAYAALATTESFIADRTADPASLKQAHADAEKAIAIAPDEADGYAARGYLRGAFSWDWVGAEADTKKALSLNPADPEVQLTYATLLAELGRLPEAIDMSRMAVAADPLSNSGWALLGRFLISTNDFDGADAALRESLRIYPDNSVPLTHLATLQLCRGQPTEALKTLGRIDDHQLEFYLVSAVQHSLGHSQESQAALDQTIARYAQVEAYQIAETYAWRGEKDEAFNWLQRAYRQRDAGLGALKFDPLLANLRNDPRFTALLKQINLPP